MNEEEIIKAISMEVDNIFTLSALINHERIGSNKNSINIVKEEKSCQQKSKSNDYQYNLIRINDSKSLEEAFSAQQINSSNRNKGKDNPINSDHLNCGKESDDQLLNLNFSEDSYQNILKSMAYIGIIKTFKIILQYKKIMILADMKQIIRRIIFQKITREISMIGKFKFNEPIDLHIFKESGGFSYPNEDFMNDPENHFEKELDVV